MPSSAPKTQNRYLPWDLSLSARSRFLNRPARRSNADPPRRAPRDAFPERHRFSAHRLEGKERRRPMRTRPCPAALAPMARPPPVGSEPPNGIGRHRLQCRPARCPDLISDDPRCRVAFLAKFHRPRGPAQFRIRADRKPAPARDCSANAAPPPDAPACSLYLHRAAGISSLPDAGQIGFAQDFTQQIRRSRANNRRSRKPCVRGGRSFRLFRCGSGPMLRTVGPVRQQSDFR